MTERVAIFLPSLIAGGAERSALFVAEALAVAGYEVDLVVAGANGGLADHPFVRAHLVDLGAPAPLLSLRRYRRYLESARPDLVISFVHSANFISGLAALNSDIPFIVSVRNSLDKAFWDQWWVRRWFGFGMERRLYARALRIHTLSQGLADQVRSRFGTAPDRIVVTQSAVEPIGEDGEGACLHADMEARALEPFIVSAGRLAAIKDFPCLIRAFAQAKIDPALKLLILGDGPERRRLERLAAQLGVEGRVRMVGHRASIMPWLRRSRGFVFASRAEGLPRVLIEALTARIPVIATRSAGGAAELLGNGRFGMLVPVRDVGALTRAIEDLAAGRIQAAPSAELDAHLAQFEPQAVAATYVEMVRGALAESGR